MTRVIVRDGTEVSGGSLNFDLAEVLAALGPRSAASEWILRDLNYVSKDEQDIPAFQHGDGARISGAELISGLPKLLQMIDGEFTGVDGVARPWVVVRAVDSGWWEVMSDDPGVLEAIRTRFKNVHEQS